MGSKSTGSKMTRNLGLASLAGIGALVVFAFVVSPPHDTQQDAVRLLYIHVPSAVAAYVCLIICAVASLGFLIKKTRWWDSLALATAEIGTIYCGLVLITGVIWGRPIWNTWWEWGDVRLVTTLILFLLFLGYLAIRAMPAQSSVTQAKRASVVAIIAVVDIPVINRSVEWWENSTLHQRSTLGVGKIEDWTLFTLVLGFVVFTLLTFWLVIHRFRVSWLSVEAEEAGLQEALLDRQQEDHR